jgi:hypothetical protein
MFGGRYSHTKFSLRDIVELVGFETRVSVDFVESVKAEVSGVRNYLFAVAYAANVFGDVYLGRNIGFRSDFIERVDSEVSLSKYISFGLNLRESVFAVVNGGFTDEDVFVIDISIPPGAEIRIDSEYFTVTLNGENIIHHHFGDWVIISRDTLELMVSSDGPLESQISYMERYI